MPAVCFYFQVHQPIRVKRYQVFDIGMDHEYFNDTSDTDLNNVRILKKVAQKSYLPTNRILLELLQRHPEFRVSFSFSGVFLEQIERHTPEVLRSFQQLVATGRVELLSETYYHSLAFLYSREEFRAQVALHTAKIQELFGITPRIFRNTELIYNNELAQEVFNLGYRGILAEGADHILGWRSPNFVYHSKGLPSLALLLKNYRLSDDIAFRFSESSWSEHPLTAQKFAKWISATNGSADVVNLFMDYETFGEHQWEETGIFHFLKAFPEEFLAHPDNSFVTPSEAIEQFPMRGPLDFPEYVSWADTERDLSAWRSNEMQHDALDKIYELEEVVQKTGNHTILEDWRRMQTSDHYYYMCTKWFADGDIHKYFSPYETPYDAFLSFMNVYNDLQLRIKRSNSN